MKIHTLVYAKMPNMAILCESRRGPCKAPTLCLFQNRKGKNPHSDLYLEKEECPGSKLQSYQKIPQFPRDVDSFIPLLCTSVLDLCQKYLYLEIFGEKSHFQAYFFLKFLKQPLYLSFPCNSSEKTFAKFRSTTWRLVKKQPLQLE